ncbi:MAG: FAD-dependent oxidoreductase, partial [Rhodobacteraceae bacterium]|nr:FAD-dependent oxidoreductase [Paracoccaceae bacterium]
MKKVLVIGGGPAGLYFAISVKLHEPQAKITVIERNKADDTFGWGVVLSDETLENLTQNDPVSAAEIRSHFAYWDDIALHHKGQKLVSSGHGFCGIGRKRLLSILQNRARDLGVDLQFGSDVAAASSYMADYDVIVAADGLNSRTRTEFSESFKPDTDLRACQFVWLGTRQKFDDAFTFIFEQTEKGWIWAHAYQFDDDTATFIVECSQSTYDAYGFANLDQHQSIAICEEIFANHLDGHALMTNANHIRGSAWIQFPRVLCETWYHENVVLLGDASATAHFSIGSGTKLALESAISLAENITQDQPLDVAFD